jgi:hypothetical protein
MHIDNKQAFKVWLQSRQLLRCNKQTHRKDVATPVSVSICSFLEGDRG